jgi:alpha-1,2-mannosyltransferase
MASELYPGGPSPTRHVDRPVRWGWAGLVCFAVLVVLFGVVVETRSALMRVRMGDLDVFLRAAWAVRAGEDIYTSTDDHGFHYHYPPLLAILLTPLADPPAGARASWVLPYPVAVALCYLLSLLCLAISVHWVAAALEERLSDPSGQSSQPGSRRWWALRLLPVLACLPPIGHTLMRGQVNLPLLLLLCGTITALLRGRRFQGGLWLAGAICLKVIPAFLLLYPLFRRDGRCLLGCAAGLVIGMLLIPLAVFGPTRTVACYQEWVRVLVLPGLGQATDHTRDKELIDATGTDSQSFQVVLHNSLYPDRTTRPPSPSAWVRRAHWLAGGLLTVLTLVLAGWRRKDAIAELLVFGSLVLNMLLLSPVCHLHYFALSVLLFLGLLAAAWEGQPTPHPGWGLGLLGVVHFIANLLPQIPGLEPVRDGGLATYAALLLWVTAGIVLWRRSRRRVSTPPAVALLPRVA